MDTSIPDSQSTAQSVLEQATVPVRVRARVRVRVRVRVRAMD
jgi:hypothetical protein